MMMMIVLFSVTVFSFVNKVYVINAEFIYLSSGTLCYTDDIYTDVSSVFFTRACY